MATMFMPAAQGQCTHSARTNTFMPAAQGQRTHSARTNSFMPAAQGQRTHSARTNSKLVCQHCILFILFGNNIFEGKYRDKYI